MRTSKDNISTGLSRVHY